MKIGGIEVKGPNEEILVLPRLEEDIVIKARAVTDMDPFEALCPDPKAPGIRTRDGFRPNEKDPSYLQMVAKHGEQRLAYLIVKSLEPSDIEWERVNLDDPGTWSEWQLELQEAGLSSIEVNRVAACVMQANSLDEEKLTAAREVFLRSREEELKESSGRDTELASMPSGTPVSD